MVVLVITVSGYMIYNFFTDSNDTLQRCVTGTCVKANECMPDGAAAGRPCGPDDVEANCVQSFEDIPDRCTVEAQEQEEESEPNQDQGTEPIQNGEQETSSDENPSADQVYIEVREASSSDAKGENTDTITLTEDDQLPLHIWARGAETATCQVTILQDKQINDSLPQAEEPCGNPIGAQSRATADQTITINVNTTQIADSSATYDLQVITRGNGERLASIEKEVRT
jgi:hypothetical protein